MRQERPGHELHNSSRCGTLAGFAQGCVELCLMWSFGTAPSSTEPIPPATQCTVGHNRAQSSHKSTVRASWCANTHSYSLSYIAVRGVGAGWGGGTHVWLLAWLPRCNILQPTYHRVRVPRDNPVPHSCCLQCVTSPPKGPPPHQAVAAPHLSSDVSDQEQLRQLLLLDAHTNLLGGKLGCEFREKRGRGGGEAHVTHSGVEGSVECACG